MCNCGKKTIEDQKPSYPSTQIFYQQEMQPLQNGIHFKYVGSTALTAIGNITGRRYRFNYTNDIQLIDKKDAVAMRNVPVLQEVKLQ